MEAGGGGDGGGGGEGGGGEWICWKWKICDKNIFF